MLTSKQIPVVDQNMIKCDFFKLGYIGYICFFWTITGSKQL